MSKRQNSRNQTEKLTAIEAHCITDIIISKSEQNFDGNRITLYQQYYLDFVKEILDFMNLS